MKSSLLSIQNVSLTIPQLEKPILSNINYEINDGDFIVILGSNGSGKSSLLKLIDKQYQPSLGKLLLKNKPLNQYSSKQFSHHIKTLTQNCQASLFTSLTVLENYLMIKQQYEPHSLRINTRKDRDFFENYSCNFNLNLPKKMDQLVEKLSGGEQQALALALTVLYPPQILLLDENTSALDPKSAESIMRLTQEMVAKYKITCLLTTHDLTIAEQYGNRLLALRHGEIYQTFEYHEKEKLTQTDLLAACY